MTLELIDTKGDIAPVNIVATPNSTDAVSYTHLDVYKRQAFDSMAIRDYWFSTGTPTYLVRLLQHSREQISSHTSIIFFNSEISALINHG